MPLWKEPLIDKIVRSQNLVWTFSEKRKVVCCPRNQAPEHFLHYFILQTTDMNYFIIILYSKSCKKIKFTCSNCAYTPFNVNLDLLFKRLGWYFYSSAWFLKNVLFEQKNIIIWHKWYFVENRRDYGTCLKNAINVLVA